MKSLRLLLSVAVAMPILAEAQAVPGEYSFITRQGGYEGICLVADGTWYSTTFAGWSGRWKSSGRTTFIQGNWDNGHGNSSIQWKDDQADWQEWTDDLDVYEIWRKVLAPFQVYPCNPPPSQQNQRALMPGLPVR